MDTALGMVEVRGFLSAVAASDSMLKAADVHIQSSQRTAGGLTTVVIRGDVGAVRASVEAGVEIARQLQGYLSHHVIARVDQQTDTLVDKKITVVTSAITDFSSKKAVKSDKSVKLDIIEEQPITNDSTKDNLIADEDKSDNAATSYSEESLQKMKFLDLRALAYRLDLKNITRKEIKSANRQRLVQAILEDQDKGDKNE